MNPTERMKHLARLAADERTPEGERRNAALALAKMVDTHGAPESGSDPVFDAMKRVHAKLVVDLDVKRAELDVERRRREAADRERKSLEEKLRQAGDEVTRLNRELKEKHEWRAELDALTRRATQAEALVKSLRGQREAKAEDLGTAVEAPKAEPASFAPFSLYSFKPI